VWQLIHDRATAGIAELIERGAPGAGTQSGLPDETSAWMLAKAAQSANNGLAQWWWEHREVPRERVRELSMALLWRGFAGLISSASAAGTDGASSSAPLRD
jgi:hypothetical protein